MYRVFVNVFINATVIVLLLMKMTIIIVADINDEKWNELPHGDKMYTNEKHLPCCSKKSW